MRPCAHSNQTARPIVGGGALLVRARRAVGEDVAEVGAGLRVEDLPPGHALTRASAGARWAAIPEEIVLADTPY